MGNPIKKWSLKYTPSTNAWRPERHKSVGLAQYLREIQSILRFGVDFIPKRTSTKRANNLVPSGLFPTLAFKNFTPIRAYGYIYIVMDDPIYQISQFPQDGQIWRVNLLGEINRNPPVPSDPLVEVLMSPVVRDQPRILHFSSTITMDHQRRRSCWMNAGYLPLVRIGSLWRDGVRLEQVGLGDTTAEPFFRVDITSKTSRLVPANMLLSGFSREYLIPHFEYPLGGRGLRTWFLSIDHGGIPHRILIPLMEVGRFYYFCSSQLTKHLLWGNLDEHGGHIFNREKSPSPINGVGHIHLRKSMDDNDAWVVSRLAHSSLALSRAQTIHNSLIVKAANGEPLHPQILPPFDGQTDLIVRGKWINSGGVRRFLVYWISSCSHPFPSDYLLHSRDFDNRSDGVHDTDRPEVNVPRCGSAQETEGSRRRLRSDTEPRANLARMESLIYESRFTDIKKKTRKKVDKFSCEYRASSRRTPNAVVDGWSSGDGTSGTSDAGPIKIVTKVDGTNDASDHRHRSPAYPPSFEAMEKIVSQLDENPDVTCRFLHVKGGVGHGNATLFPTNCPENPGWPYVEGNRRQALVVEINYAGTYHYLFEAERKATDRLTTLYMHHTAFDPLIENVMFDVLNRCAKNEGTWLKKDEKVELPDLKWRKLKHTWKSPTAFSARLLGIMKVAIAKQLVAPLGAHLEQQQDRNIPSFPAVDLHPKLTPFTDMLASSGDSLGSINSTMRQDVTQHRPDQ
jgi:hypothetical protein